MNLFVKYRWLLVLLVGIKMKKTIDNHKTIFTNYFHSPTISNTTNKISYLPSLNFNFEQMLQNRVKADNIDVPKSIFVLKYKLKKQDIRYNPSSHKHNNFPQLSISTTLDSSKDSDKKKLFHKLNKTPSYKNFNPNLGIHKRRQTPLFQNFYQSNYSNMYQKSFTTQKNHQNQKIIRGTNQMIVGNRTILNFRSTHRCNQQKNKRKLDNKVKFGTFKSPATYDICPWGQMGSSNHDIRFE